MSRSEIQALIQSFTARIQELARHAALQRVLETLGEESARASRPRGGQGRRRRKPGPKPGKRKRGGKERGSKGASRRPARAQRRKKRAKRK